MATGAWLSQESRSLAILVTAEMILTEIPGMRMMRRLDPDVGLMMLSLE